MVHPVQYLSPRQLAAALDVSESTIKRWVDAGRIPAGRTRGGHRRIALSAALEFIRDDSVRLAHPEALGLDPELVASTLRDVGVSRRGRFVGTSSFPPRAQVADALATALRQGDVIAARSLMIALHVGGWSAARFIDGPLSDAMARIGELYQHGREGIFHEHRATAIALQLMAELRSLIEGSLVPDDDGGDDALDARPAAIGGAPAQDPYLLPSRAVALVLTQAGMHPTELGPFTPLDVLAEGARQIDARLVWVSISADPPTELAAELRQLADTLDAERRVLAVGGRTHATLALEPHPNIYRGNTLVELDAYARGIVRQLLRP